MLLDQFHGDFSHEPFIEDWPSWARPFVLASVGATHLSAGGTLSFTRFSFGIGGGIRLYATRHFGWKIQAEWLPVVVDPNVAVVCPDPYGAAMWSWFTNGNTDTNDGDSVAEGIGQGRVTKNIEGITVDKAYRIDDQTALTIVYQLLREEGLFLGLSSGINVAGAVRFAKERGPGQTLVTLLCDSGHNYQSTLYNNEWLATKHLNPRLPLESVFA